jgi:hypothetical protein
VAPDRSSKALMYSRHEPHPVPAPQWSPTCSTVCAPSLMALVISVSVVTTQRQTITAVLPGERPYLNLKLVFNSRRVKRKIDNRFLFDGVSIQ